jgi:predicted Zn-dependent protease
LISAVASADELASVLAHELSHVTQRHIARMMAQQGRQGPMVVAAMILGMLAASRTPSASGMSAANAVMVGGSAAAMQSQLNFSRDMEREADRIGYGVMTDAGFEPQGFVSMFEKLQQAARLNDNGSFPYLRSHPMTNERIADAQARQQLLPLRPPLALRAVHAMMAARAQVLTGLGVDALRAISAQGSDNNLAAAAQAKQAGALYGATLADMKLREWSSAKQHLARLQALAHLEAPAVYAVRLLSVELALAWETQRRRWAWSSPKSVSWPWRTEQDICCWPRVVWLPSNRRKPNSPAKSWCCGSTSVPATRSPGSCLRQPTNNLAMACVPSVRRPRRVPWS